MKKAQFRTEKQAVLDNMIGVVEEISLTLLKENQVYKDLTENFPNDTEVCKSSIGYVLMRSKTGFHRRA